MFLKRFEAKGFKSFADYTVINFNHNAIGVVGPNGSGKSNIVDGLKWVLGEQSLKQLRGKVSTDFIFSGSDGRDPANFAEVSLTFDNSKGILKTPLKEITVTRRLTKGINKNEYFINGELSQLSEIKAIFIDMGLSKGSLGIISQGTVSWFTEAKAIERRRIFEDAAGIGQYTVAKKNTINQLEKAKLHLNEAQIILNEAERAIKRLTKQAEKAQLYLSKKEMLEKIEVTILAKDILDYRNNLEHVTNQLKNLESSFGEEDDQLKTLQEKLVNARQKLQDLEAEINLDNQDLMILNNKLSDLQTQKTILENQLASQLDSASIEEKIEIYKKLIQNTKSELEKHNANKTNLDNEIATFESIKQQLTVNYNEILQKLNSLRREFQDKQYELKNVRDGLANKYKFDYGLKAILDNKEHLNGIYDSIENLISVENQFEVAILTALGRAIKNVVVKSTKDAQRAVEFLKKNRAGKATFMPIEDLTFAPFSDDYYEILNQLDGFVGMANHLVEIDEKFQVAIDALLNKIIIASDLESALTLSKYTNRKFRVISLEGDIVNPMGIITGGFDKRNKTQALNLKEKEAELTQEIENLSKNISELQKQADEISYSLHSNNEKLSSKQNQVNVLNNTIEDLANNLKTREMELNQLDASANNSEHSTENEITKISNQLIDAQSQFNSLRSTININMNLKNNLSSDVQEYESKLNELNAKNNQIRDEMSQLSNRKVKIESVLENAINRLAENYQMTPDFAIENYNHPLEMSDDDARSLIRTLRSEIQDMGNINLEAAEELKNRQEDLEFKRNEYEKLEKACKGLENIINELNKKAIETFKNVVNQVNENLPGIFEYLFGGGTCKVIYDDPENVLESGIEIHAYLPGKTITNLMLFSGGEKTLIALAVLFAILKVTALPLVILDEAESALDPANVERFGNIIKEYSDKTQFITITHRPGTMERCDILYGVTMLVRGISKIVSVEMSQAMKYVEKEN